MSWPLAALRVRSGDLLLRPMTEADLPDVVALLPDDVELDPSLSPDRATSVRQTYWNERARWSADAWALSFLVLRDSALVGVQVLEGTDFPVLRTVDTSSWLAVEARGRGTGKAMRAAVLSFAFGTLGARAAITSAWQDNASSLGVSRALGYRDNGVHLQRRGDGADVMVHLRLVADEWSGPSVQVDGYDAEPFGL